jgi:hypothetical protein
MSVCIASMCGHRTGESYIVTMSDTMISTAHGELTADNAALKQWYFAGQWSALFAGNDTGAVRPILRAVSDRLGDTNNPTVDMVKNALVEAYHGERASRASADILGIYRMTLDDFLSTGRERFGDDRFGKLCDQMDAVIVDCDFLVSGFDGDGEPHVFDVLNGTPHDHDYLGYWAIGSGGRLALGGLSAREHSMYLPLEDCVYNLSHARVLAESAYGVGRGDSVAIVQEFDHVINRLPTKLLNGLRATVLEHTRSTPPDAVEAIRGWSQQLEHKKLPD